MKNLPTDIDVFFFCSTMNKLNLQGYLRGIPTRIQKPKLLLPHSLNKNQK